MTVLAANELMTVGYEGRTIDEVLDVLEAAGVEIVADVRIRAGSRKPGLSKSSLRDHLAKRGIDYVHFRALGTPHEMLAEVRKTGRYDFPGYREHMLAQPAALADLVNLSARRRTALLCYEAEPSECHRSIIAEHVAPKIDARIRDL